MNQIKLIGICLSTAHEEDHFSFIKELNKHAVKKGYRLVIFNSCADLYEQNTAVNEESSAVFRLVPYERLSALILFPNIMYNDATVAEAVKNCHRYNIPVISMDKAIDGCLLFTFSNAEIFGQLCRHVICDHGARNVFMMAGFKDNVYSEERIRVFKKVLEENGLPVIEENIGYGCFWELPTIDVLNKWFVEEKRDVPDAIICANDFMAITVSSYLQSLGYKIPEDCIITGFDGIKQAEYLPPNITTCKQDFDEMGRLIIDTIIRIEQGEQIQGPFYVDFNIIYSQSCGCKPLSYEKVTSSITDLISSLRLTEERQKMILSTQNIIPKITFFDHLPRLLMKRYKINTCIFAINEGIFSPPDFGTKYTANNCFGQNVDILFHCYGKTELEHCTIPVKRLFPRYDILFENETPVIVCCSVFSDMVLGYCAFQPDININEYEKIDVFMNATGTALGDFHNRMQIKSMNRKLLEINDDLQKISQRDFMTGLFNRRGFFDKLDSLTELPENYGRQLMFISADLDGLKVINDNFGHAEGDNAIIIVGKALLSSSLHSEICARFGGDEFGVALICPDSNTDLFFEDFKKRFLDYLWDYNRNSGKPYQVRASIGYCAAPINNKLNIEKMIELADEKMYEYKAKNKTRQ